MAIVAEEFKHTAMVYWVTSVLVAWLRSSTLPQTEARSTVSMQKETDQPSTYQNRITEKGRYRDCSCP